MVMKKEKKIVVYFLNQGQLRLHQFSAFFLNREEHERIGDIIKKYGHFLKVYSYMNFFSFYLVFPLSGFFHLTLSSLKEHCTELFFFSLRCCCSCCTFCSDVE